MNKHRPLNVYIHNVENLDLFGSVADDFVDEILDEMTDEPTEKILSPFQSLLQEIFNWWGFDAPVSMGKGYFALTKAEQFFYQFLSDEESEFCYFYFRRFPQLVLSEFFRVSQASISYRRLHLMKKFNIIREHVIPLLEGFHNHYDIISKVLSDAELEFFRLAIIKMSKSYFKYSKFGFSSARVVSEYDTVREKIYREHALDELYFLLRDHFEWERLGREYYCRKNITQSYFHIGHHTFDDVQLLQSIDSMSSPTLQFLTT